MNIKLIMMTVTAGVTLSFAPSIHTERTHGHEFAPQNNLRRPISQNLSGITEEEFNAVLDKVYEIYKPIFKEHKAEFVIQRFWDDDTVNAYAFREGKKWNIAMYGGLARHEEVTRDGFMLVACHEIGHHLGGYPRGGWASNEGNSDYYGTLKCLRRMWNNGDSIEIVKKMKVDKKAVELCEEQWEGNEERAICERASMAGKSLGRLLAVLGGQEMPEFDTPDSTVVTKTNHAHPAAQCRLDTYFHGALCTVDWNQDMDEEDPNVGACKVSEVGGRRACWFKEPSADENQPPGNEDEGEKIRW
ncbi:MAG: hypothetical protein A4S09_08090 [Proteobacteria bacterium SG_bin7]|nr:MAG: hypothetical protein A4S09_08090 [Proteobacteria bacterium SG_bin7]